MKRIALIVEDPLVRRVIAQILGRGGFGVHEVGPCLRPECPQQCSLECCAPGCRPDLLVLEVIAPRSCSGIDGAQKALLAWPDVKILLITASPREAWPGDASEIFATLPGRSCTLLPKPFTAQALRNVVDDLLSG